jgi:SnoaL-like domain
MNTMEIANKLIELCRQGKNDESLRTLFADNAVSVEAMAPPGGQQETVGLQGILAKGEWWRNNHEVHSAVIAGPWPHGNRFIVGFKYEVTFKPTSQKMNMEEMGLFTIENGKIVREEFFYSS